MNDIKIVAQFYLMLLLILAVVLFVLYGISARADATGPSPANQETLS